jgi:hypothetical protein
MVNNELHLVALCVHEKTLTTTYGAYTLLLHKHGVIVAFGNAIGALEIAAGVCVIRTLLGTVKM